MTSKEQIYLSSLSARIKQCDFLYLKGHLISTTALSPTRPSGLAPRYPHEWSHNPAGIMSSAVVAVKALAAST